MKLLAAVLAVPAFAVLFAATSYPGPVFLLVMLLGVDPELVEGHNIPTDNPHVAFAYMKHLWHSKNQQVGKEQC